MNEPSPISQVAVREEERRRLARLLEEGLGQSLNLLLAQANVYHAALSPSAVQARQALGTLTAMADHALTDLHDLVADLNPTTLQDLGLGAALETLPLRIKRRYGLTVTLDLADGATAIPTPRALAAYRIAQEALHNAGQHAGAERVGLGLRLERDGLRLTIGDWRNLPRVLDDFQAGRYPPLIKVLIEGGPYRLFEMAQEHGYQTLADGYAGKCHLCVDVRLYLVEMGDFAELRPHGFYENI